MPSRAGMPGADAVAGRRAGARRGVAVRAASAGAAGFWLVLVAAAAWSFSELLPGGVRMAALRPGLELCLGAAWLLAAGWAITILGRLRLSAGSAALQIGIGQIALLAWLYARSVLGFAADRFVGLALPVSGWELAAATAAMVWLASRKASIRSVARLLPGLAWVCVAIFVIAQRELPREIMLSSDPDQHLFFTAQILRLGLVPFELGSWGPASFGYPAGFASLCALWTWLGGVGVSDSVQVQPLLQSLLAVLALGSLVARAVAPDDVRLQAGTSFFVLIVFFGFLPFTLTTVDFNLAKTGSLSTLLLLVTMLTLTVEGASAGRTGIVAPGLLIAGVASGLLANVNPAAALVPGLLYGGAVVVASVRRTMLATCRAGIWYLPAPVLVVLTDPYYIGRFVLSRPVPRLVSSTSAGNPESFPALAWGRIVELATTAEWLRPFLFVSYFGRNLGALAVIAVATIVVVSRVPHAMRWHALLAIAAVPLIVIVLEFTLLPAASALGSHADYYLLGPYLAESLVRLAYLWLMGLLVLAFALSFRQRSTVPVRAAATIVVVALLMIPVRSARDALPNEVRMQPRYGLCEGIGCPTPDDQVVLRALRDEYYRYVAGGGALDFSAIPKVLLPNAMLRSNGEDWIMPTGASRSYSVTGTFPAAFFYYKGSADYSYANYVDRVCRRLDRDWLKARNVLYLFVPADRRDVCVAGLDDLLANGRVLARSGRAVAIKLD